MATVANAPKFDPQAVNEQPSMQKETAVEQAKKYYMSELAALLGVDAKVLSNAKYSRGTPRPGSNIHFVVEKMKEMGITWENVVPACRRESANSARSVTHEDIEPLQVDASGNGSTPEPQADTSVSDDGDCCDCEEQSVPLELVLAELKRRLPGASITITIA